jgi:hypothetical protein
MQKSEIRIREMLVRVRQFILSRIAAFPAGLPGHDAYVIVDASIKNMERLSAAQSTHGNTVREKTKQKKIADAALRDIMESISHTAGIMSRRFPGIEEKFRLPAKKDGQTWLACARSFATEAEPLAEEFVGRGISPDFIDDLKARILAVDEASDDRAENKNVSAGWEAELAAWESASHVERAPQHADDDKEEPPTEPPPAQG